MTHLLAALAVFRVSRMIAREDGPFDVFAKIQTWAEIRQERNWFARGLLCPLCLSFWFALLAALFFLPLSLSAFLLTWFGLAGGAAILYLLTER